MTKEYVEIIRTIYLIVVEIVQITLFIVAIYFICQVATGKIKININVEKIIKDNQNEKNK